MHLDNLVAWVRGINWAVIMRVPIYYYLVAWVAWVLAHLSRRKRPVVIRPTIIVLDEAGEKTARQQLYRAMMADGWSAYGNDDVGMYWTKD